MYLFILILYTFNGDIIIMMIIVMIIIMIVLFHMSVFIYSFYMIHSFNGYISQVYRCKYIVVMQDGSNLT